MEENDYVLATKYSDGSPNDPWEVGFYAGWISRGLHGAIRHFVKNTVGKIGRPTGYRKVKKITVEQGVYLVRHIDDIENGDTSLYKLLKQFNKEPTDERR